LLDLMVFGKRSGLTAASRAASRKHGKLTLKHLERFRTEARKHGNPSGVISMILPAYTRKVGRGFGLRLHPERIQMNVHEFQAKSLFAQFGVPVPREGNYFSRSRHHLSQ
jgi:hypothetical protein